MNRPRTRYALRIAASDLCFIPILGDRRWRLYWAALRACRRFNASRDRADATYEPAIVWDTARSEPVGR